MSDNSLVPELVEPPVQQVIDKDGAVVPPKDVKLEHDFEVARNNIHNLLESATLALDDALMIARASELAKDWEAYNQLLEVVSNLNIKLLELNERYKKLLPKQAEADVKQNSTVNNTAVFVGTSSDLQKLIKQTMKGMK